MSADMIAFICVYLMLGFCIGLFMQEKIDLERQRLKDPPMRLGESAKITLVYMLFYPFILAVNWVNKL